MAETSCSQLLLIESAMYVCMYMLKMNYSNLVSLKNTL